MRLEYITVQKFIEDGYRESAIAEFDCGVSSFNVFLHDNRQEWEDKLAGVTYLLIDLDEDKDKVNIYAYATLSTAGLLDSTIENDYRYISSLEIRLFAIHKKFRKVTDENGVKYSHMFFALLLQGLWLAATSRLSFKTIFLQANNAGKPLYEEFGFVEIEDYIAPTVDDKVEVEECIPMLCMISDELMYSAFL